MASTIALVILSPFALIFGYATWHEYTRFKTDGPTAYGLTYDPETNTTSIGPVTEENSGYDHADYDPNALATAGNDASDDAHEDTADADTPPDTTDAETAEAAHAEADDSSKDRQT